MELFCEFFLTLSLFLSVCEFFVESYHYYLRLMLCFPHILALLLDFYVSISKHQAQTGYILRQRRHCIMRLAFADALPKTPFVCVLILK